MYEATSVLYQPIQSCHVVCLGISNKSVAVPRHDNIRSCCPVWALYIQYMCMHCMWCIHSLSSVRVCTCIYVSTCVCDSSQHCLLEHYMHLKGFYLGSVAECLLSSLDHLLWNIQQRDVVWSSWIHRMVGAGTVYLP